MPEPHLGADLEQLFATRPRLPPVGPMPSVLRGAPQERGVAGGVGGRQQHQPLGRLRQCAHPPQVVVVEMTGQGAVGGTAKPPASSASLIPLDQLQQRQRVAAGLGDDPVTDLLVQVTGDGGGEQRPGVLVGEPFDASAPAGPGTAARRPPPGPRTGAATDSASRRRPTNPRTWRGGVIEPLGVVDQAHQRPLGGDLGQQAQHGETDQEPIRSASRSPARRPPATPRCWGSGSAASSPSIGCAQLVQRRERQLQLGLDAGDLSDPTAGRLPGAVVQQRGLADPGLTPDDQHGALAATNAVQQAIERLALA